ncbi:hypothetical protein SAMN05443550_11633 [Pedobacter hartonius]|uniref:Uncharacterized protein n=1 Tax=Pedobacter hartonius TaxID=425514 RepID=A0A1H4HDX4_9SPHI|nr:hypothetical protein SAMN05443550_11633 [Pedobacter hartonius]
MVISSRLSDFDYFFLIFDYNEPGVITIKTRKAIFP